MKQLSWRLLAAAAIAALTGCASAPPTPELFAALASSAQVVTASAAAVTTPLVAVPGTRLAFEMTAADGVVSHQKYRSFYRPISMKANDSGEASFTLTSLCACFGFDKRIAIPMVAAFDAAGAPLAIDNARYQHVRASGGPFRIAVTGKVRTARAGEVRLLVIANNEMPDVVVSTTRMVNQYGHHVGDATVKASPVGQFWFSAD